jgi:hypothetical protein
VGSLAVHRAGRMLITPSISLDMGARMERTSGSSVTHGGLAGVRKGTSGLQDPTEMGQGSAAFLKCPLIPFFDYAHSKL